LLIVPILALLHGGTSASQASTPAAQVAQHEPSGSGGGAR